MYLFHLSSVPKLSVRYVSRSKPGTGLIPPRTVIALQRVICEFKNTIRLFSVKINSVCNFGTTHRRYVHSLYKVYGSISRFTQPEMRITATAAPSSSVYVHAAKRCINTCKYCLFWGSKTPLNDSFIIVICLLFQRLALWKVVSILFHDFLESDLLIKGAIRQP